MSGLVTMIVLAYLLLIAVAVALWAAVSLRRRSTHSDSQASATARGMRAAGSRDTTDSGEGHDAYRGIRAKRRKTQPALADPFVVDEGAANASKNVPKEDAFERFLRANEDFER